MSKTPSREPSDPDAESRSQLLSYLDKATRRHDDAARKLQQTRWRIGSSLIVLGPLAAMVATYHFARQIEGTRGELLSAVEVLLLAVALVAAFWRFGGSQHESWIRQRLCTEILRREQFLLGARVGPYLDPGVLPIRVEDRINQIGSNTRDLVDLVPMVAEHNGQSWREELEDWRGRPLPALPDLAGAIAHYLEYRVEDQRKWFANKSAAHSALAYTLERWVRTILILAVVLAIVEFFVEFFKDRAHANFGTYPEQWLFIFVISLPISGAALVGFQSLLESERLGRSYAYHSERLEHFASRLRKLQSNLVLKKSEPGEIQFQFMRTVLEVEEMFSEELLQWRLVMEPRMPRAEA